MFYKIVTTGEVNEYHDPQELRGALMAYGDSIVTGFKTREEAKRWVVCPKCKKNAMREDWGTCTECKWHIKHVDVL